MLIALAAACSRSGSGQPEKVTEPVELYAAVVSAGASQLSSDPVDHDGVCARQKMVFVFDGDWTQFLGRLEGELPADFQRTEASRGVVIFNRLLPGDVESIEITPDSVEQSNRAQLKYEICAG